MKDEEVLALLQSLSHELRDVDVGASIDRVALCDLSPLRFSTEYVAKNKPCIITGATDQWPALCLWTPEYLTQRLGDAQVTVDVTPDGRGDAIVSTAGGDVFATPDERRMSVAQFFQLLTELRGRQAGGACEVPYVQHQNSSLSEEFSQLLGDVQPRMDWADQVFGGLPEATNLWIGDERSVTSFHKDHYENMYAVIAGTKVFTLLPPSDVYRMYLTRCPAARYVQQGPVPPDAGDHNADTMAAEAAAAAAATEGLSQPLALALLVVEVTTPPASVVWCPVDPYPQGSAARTSAAQRFPLFFDPTLPAPLVAEVRAGEVLYLPCMWYHHVGQRGGGLRPPAHGAAEEASAADSRGGDGSGGSVTPGAGCDGRALSTSGSSSGVRGSSSGVPGSSGGMRGSDPALKSQMLDSCSGPCSSTSRSLEPGGTGGQKGSGGTASAPVSPVCTIAVNTWYDMRFDHKWAHFKLVEGLAQRIGLSATPE